MFAREHRFVANSGIPIQFGAPLRVNLLRHITQHHRNAIRDVQTCIRIIALTRFAGHDQTISGKHSLTFHLGAVAESQRPEILLHLKGNRFAIGLLDLKRVRIRDQSCASGEFITLKEIVIRSHGLQPDLLHPCGDVLGGEFGSGRSCEPPFQFIRRQIRNDRMQIVG